MSQFVSGDVASYGNVQNTGHAHAHTHTHTGDLRITQVLSLALQRENSPPRIWLYSHTTDQTGKLLHTRWPIGYKPTLVTTSQPTGGEASVNQRHKRKA